MKSKKVSKSPVLSRKNSDEKGDRSKKRSVACKQYDRLGLEDHEIYKYFSSYLLTTDQLRQLGFPQDSSLYPGKAYIYRDPEFCQNWAELDDGELCDPTLTSLATDPKLDVNAEPFFPGRGGERDEGRSSGRSSEDSDGSGQSEQPEQAVRWGQRKQSLDDSSGEVLVALRMMKEFKQSVGKYGRLQYTDLLTGVYDQEQ